MKTVTNEITSSIIVGTINRSPALGKFLQSLVDSNIIGRTDIEVLIVDNNNSHEKAEVTRALCEEFGVRFLHEQQSGKPYAINKGIINANGKYIAFTDDDVVIKDSHWIDTMVAEFEANPQLGYVSGNVKAMKQETTSEQTWEKKGGLSKGSQKRYWSQKYLNSWPYTVKPWQFNKMCAGANSMIPKAVLNQVGLFNTLLESGIIGHGTTLEIGYRIAKAGFELLYTPESEVFHSHPETLEGLKRKMYTYGVGDTAYQMCIFLEHKDFRSLWWSLIGHSAYTLESKVFKRLAGQYPFPMKYILSGLKGNIMGSYLFLYDYYLRGGEKRKKDYLAKLEVERGSVNE